MGLAMASNLQRHLATKKALSLLYSNRTMSRGAPLQALGGIPETNFSKLVSNCGIIFTMVINIKPIPNQQYTNKPPGLKRLSPTKPPIPSDKLRPLPKRQDLCRLLNSAPRNREHSRIRSQSQERIVCSSTRLRRESHCRRRQVGLCNWRSSSRNRSSEAFDPGCDGSPGDRLRRRRDQVLASQDCR